MVNYTFKSLKINLLQMLLVSFFSLKLQLNFLIQQFSSLLPSKRYLNQKTTSFFFLITYSAVAVYQWPPCGGFSLLHSQPPLRAVDRNLDGFL